VANGAGRRVSRGKGREEGKGMLLSLIWIDNVC